MQRITPSAINPWDGTPVEGSPYTAEQLRMMKHERPNWTRFSDRMVTLEWRGGSSWTPPERTVVPCPIIAWTKDKARVLVITPAGFTQWMSATASNIP